MSLSFDRVVAIGLLIAINTARTLYKHGSWVEQVVERFYLSSNAPKPAHANSVYAGIGILTVAQIMMAVNGMDRLDKPKCKQITSDSLQSTFYVGAIVSAFLLPEFIYHIGKDGKGPTVIAEAGLVAALFSSALATMRSGWHLRHTKCNKSSTVWKVWFGEGMAAMAIAAAYAMFLLRNRS